jgi:hypothetical protein
MASCSALKAISSAVSWFLGMVVWADIVIDVWSLVVGWFDVCGELIDGWTDELMGLMDEEKLGAFKLFNASAEKSKLRSRWFKSPCWCRLR